jgi:hypothetical protein
MASPAASWSQTRAAVGMARQCCRPVGFRKKGAESLAFLIGNLAWIFRPIDDLEEHSPLEHFGFEGGRVLFPLRCFADTEPSFLALFLSASSTASAPRTPSYIIVRLSLVKA